MLLMPLLLLWYYFCTPAPMPLVLMALFFAFFGDVFLIYPEKSWLFVLGLISFAVCHACYITVLFSAVTALPPLWMLALIALPYLAGTVLILRLLWPRLPKVMFLPCLLYMSIISILSIGALLFALTYNTPTSWLAFVGSLFFLVSDGTLSIVTFKQRIPYRYVIVMGTYIIAQTMLTVSIAFTGSV